MPTIQRRRGKNGKETYTVTIRIKGIPSQTATFDRLTDAKRWSASTESSIREGRHLHAVEAKRHNLSDVINRFLGDKTISKKTKAKIRREKRKIFLGVEPILLKLVQKNQSAKGTTNPREMIIIHGSSNPQLICH